MKSIMTTVVLPIVWVAMLLALVLSSPRHPLMDRLTLIVILAIVGLFHFERKKFVFIVTGFAAVVMVTEIDTIDAGPFTGVLQAIAHARYPQPRAVAFDEFIGIHENQAWHRTIESEVSFFRFVSMNLIALGTCLIGDRWISQSRRATKKAPAGTGA
jgi:hypothetical protein